MNFDKLLKVTWGKITGSSLPKKNLDPKGNAYCYYCEQKLEKNWKVCPYCGLKIIIGKNVNFKEEDQGIQDNTSVVHATEIEVKDQVQEKKYHVHPEPPKDLPLPKRLVSHLPDADTIVITSYGNEGNSFGKRYHFGGNTLSSNEAFIQYYPLKKNYDFECSVFVNSFHPFLREFTENEVICSGNILKDLLSNINQPSYFEVSEHTLFVNMGGGYYDTGYKETPKYIKYMQRYQESFHDGGGSGSKVWFLYATSGKETKQELTQKKVMNGICLPTCKGYWIEEKHLYLVDPWGIPGVFEYYCCKKECRDFDSDEEVWEVGVKGLEN